MRIVYLIGPAGAGKSTFTNAHPEMVSVSRDQTRAELGLCKPGEKVVCSPSLEAGLINETQHKKYEDLIKAGQDFIVDDTNLVQKYLKESVETMKSYATKHNQPIQLEAVVFHTPAEVCFARREKDGFSKETIEKMCQSLKNINFKRGYFADAFSKIEHILPKKTKK